MVAPAPTRAEPTLEDLRLLLRDGDAALVDLSAQDGETLPDADPAPLLEGLGAELPCGTLAMRAAARLLDGEELGGDRRLQLERLLEPPSFSALTQRDLGALRLDWDASPASRHALGSRDADRNGVPDLADAASADLVYGLARMQQLLGWDGPSSAEPLSVVLASSAWRDGSLSAGARPHLLLPRELGGEERLRTIAHQLAHAALADIAPNAPAGWEEAAATFVAERILSEAVERELEPAALLPRHLRDDGRLHPRRAVGSPGLGACRGDAAFFAWLDGPFEAGEGWLGETWAELAEQLDRAGRGGELSDGRAEQLALESLDATLGRAGSDLATAVSGYLAWSLEQELASAGRLSVDAALEGHPSSEARSGLDLPPFAQLRYAVEVPRDGGLRIGFESETRTEAEVFTLLADGGVERFPLGGGAWGDRSLRLPGGRLRAVVVLVSAPLVPADLAPWRGGGGRAEGDFRLVIEQDATYPFVLSELSVEARVDQVRIDWGTESEEDLVAWHVERARRLAGPWRRITAAPVPPSSLPGTAWSYSLVDEDLRPGTRYHYRLVGVTSSGLAERTGSASVLTLPAGPGIEGGARR